MQKSELTHQFQIIDFDKSNVELVTVVSDLLKPLKDGSARFVARVWERVSPFPTRPMAIHRFWSVLLFVVHLISWIFSFLFLSEMKKKNNNDERKL